MIRFGQYGLAEAIRNIYGLAMTKVLFPHARLIRRPFYLRGAEHFSYGTGLTLGYDCRFDLAGNGKTLRIGNNCKMNDRVHIVAHKRVSIGDDVLIASNIFISDTSHGDYYSSNCSPSSIPDNRPLVSNPVKIGNRVWIGEGAVILPGVSLGDGCIIGANSVVTKSFEAGSIIAGVPAKAIKRWNRDFGAWERGVDE